MDRISLGNRIKEVRKSQSLTQQEFAKALGISAGYVSEIEQGNKMPGSEVLISLKMAYSINSDWLLTGEGEMRKGERPQGVAEGLAPYYTGDAELREICDWLKENPGDKKAVSKLIQLLKSKKEYNETLKEALGGFAGSLIKEGI